MAPMTTYRRFSGEETKPFYLVTIHLDDDGSTLKATINKRGPVPEGDHYEWSPIGDPAEMLDHARHTASKEGVECSVELKDGVEWNPEWGTLSD
ncbi:hypothetical protein ACWTU6_27170 [Mesorhizobium sp. BHbsci]